VQGVWFRAWTVEQARARGLDGWVRNRRDGTVEAVFAGPDEAVDAMIAACWQGPPAAQVRDVAVFDEPDPVPEGFVQRPTE
ncbi:MAG: acylphosphatase, partial [Alphaproteobacteria bacterium]